MYINGESSSCNSSRQQLTMMELGTTATKSLSVRVLLALCVVSLVSSFPLPLLYYQDLAGPSPARPQYWELRPAPYNSLGGDAQAAAFFNSYMQGRFDPDRPYIQLIVPGRGDGEVHEDRLIPGGPFGPTRPTVPTAEAPTTEAPTVNCNDSLNATTVNGTNATNCVTPTSKTPDAKPSTALFMLADGTTVYSVGDKGEMDQSLSGAYELAYVARRPSTPYIAPAPAYPLVQYADYGQMQMDSLGRVPFFGSPRYATADYYEPAYIYRPVYATASRNYDVYYYLPKEANNQGSVARTQGEPASSEKEKESNEEEEVVAEEEEDLAGEPEPSVEKEEANEIAMPNAVEEVDQAQLQEQEQALVDALSSEIQAEMLAPTQEELQPGEEKMADTAETQLSEEGAEEMLAELMVHDDDYWEKELEKISDKDLINAVQVVLQQLNSRLSD